MARFGTGFEISRMTVRGLDDLGYDVYYEKTDPYDASDLHPDSIGTAHERQLEGTGNDDSDGGPK
jgi:hypothetical protein